MTGYETWIGLEVVEGRFRRTWAKLNREPSWEPFAVDLTGHAWTSVDSKARRCRLCGLLWAPRDTAWTSTDQKVGGSSPSGRAAEPPCYGGGFCHFPPSSMPRDRSLGRGWAARLRARISVSRLMRSSTSEGKRWV